MTTVEVNVITKNGNTEIKNVVNIVRKSKTRMEKGMYVVEGIKMFREIPRDLIVKAYATESFYNENKSLFEGISYELVTDSVFAFMSDTKTPQGILALVKMKKYKLDDILADKKPLIMIIDDLQDPGNLGTIVRTGEGAGITGLLITRKSVDIYNPKVIRSTMGSVFRVPFVFSSDLTRDIATLKEHGVNVCAAHLDGDKKYTEVDYNKPTAFIIGNESQGIRPEVARCADTLIKIPMHGQVESLNAAIAATILMYEAERVRSL